MLSTEDYIVRGWTTYVRSSVKHVFVQSPLLFVLAMDWVIKKAKAPRHQLEPALLNFSYLIFGLFVY